MRGIYEFVIPGFRVSNQVFPGNEVHLSPFFWPDAPACTRQRDGRGTEVSWLFGRIRLSCDSDHNNDFLDTQT
jgi:hypothetical protein